MQPLAYVSFFHARRLSSLAVVFAAAAIGWQLQQACAQPQQQRTDHCGVATVHPLATQAAADAFRQGGNAVDAAVAAALTLGVVDNHNSGLGGGCFILIRSPDGQLTAIDGRETAPAAASEDMFVVEDEVQPQLSQTGALAAGVPGALAAYELAVDRFANHSMADLILPAAKIADDGFPIDEVYAERLSRTADELRQFEVARRVFLKANGQPYQQGEVLRQPELATSYRAIAEQGTDWFYRGPFAQRTEQAMQRLGGLLTAEDFAQYRAVLREPIITEFQGRAIIGFPPPSSGGVHVAQMLNILSEFPIGELMRQQPGEAAHVIIEAMKLAFADRAHWLGDADFVRVPRGLIDTDYAATLAKRIDRDRASEVPQHGNPLPFDPAVFGRHTTHIAAADSEGYWVSITATINTSFGSKVVVPETGVVLNNEMDDFSVQPGVPNAFGLVGAANNAIAPGKRPLSSMSPTIVLDAEGNPELSVGAAGGPKIISQVLLTILRYFEEQLSLEAAVAQPRYHHQWRPDEVMLEQSADPDLVRILRGYGHTVRLTPTAGVTQAVGHDAAGGFVAVSDPRVPGEATIVTRPVDQEAAVPSAR